MTKFTVMESKRDGLCNTCRGPIAKGEMITWSRNDGANHFDPEGSKCQPVIADDAERTKYAKFVTSEIKAWDGLGAFTPTTYGFWVDAGRPAKATQETQNA